MINIKGLVGFILLKRISCNLFLALLRIEYMTYSHVLFPIRD